MTAEELLGLPTGMGTRYELLQGGLKTMSPAGTLHGRIAARICSRLDTFATAKKLGEVYGAETGFILHRHPDTVRVPDAAFVSAARIPSSGTPIGFFPGAPDVAVEVVSPGDAAEEVQAKVKAYFEAGTQQVWIIYPQTQEVAVFRSARESVVLGGDDMLEGGNVLPGFTCPVAELFA
jgi:Uma2 family endonuclease